MMTLTEDQKAAGVAWMDQSIIEPRYGRPSLLLLEDDPDIGEVVAHWVSSQGVRPVRATTVAEASHLISDLEMLGSFFQGLLADYRLPDATGIRVIEEFQTAFPKRPIALMTAYHDLPLAIWARTRGVPIFLKPLDRPLLLSWLRAVAASA